ncbi:DJ-1/PfpI family protein [Paenalcaligenes niemegkensis]|uniref:DJ-1/PfpI family protein n=1 Tax=Paenalcaligenes niemegkensis TaxID=2895469 RepID=UPI001EE88C14|nr:DJ-1/PfpI family protein [Paenalcaligenes niemegkensis]MCQ9617288.1 DJ-1/PfpI family protein [Paenalcaligenes niemegkensis]
MKLISASQKAPAADITLITGGPGWQTQIQNQQLLHFLQQRHERGDTLVSVCTGALLLGAAGLLRNCKATTKAVYAEPESPPLETLAAIEPTCQVQAALLVDEGNIITGGGVSLCIDLTLYLIERFLSEDTSDEVARIMEYSSARVANRERLPLIIQAPTTST